MVKRDIENREDLKKLMATFYERLLVQDEFKYIFFEVAKIDILHHLDIIVDFWDSALFHAQSYKRNTLQKHLDIHMDHRLTTQHFDDWLKCFNDTVDDLYEGQVANNAKVRALSIANVITMKINDLDRRRLEINN